MLTALEQFPVEMESIRLVKQSENITWRVSARDGDYVFRLHRPGYNSLEELESERAWTDALDDAGVPVPRSVRTRGDQRPVGRDSREVLP